MTALDLYRQWRLVTDLASQKRRAQRDLDAMLPDFRGSTYKLNAEGMAWELSVSDAPSPSLTVTPLASTL